MTRGAPPFNMLRLNGVEAWISGDDKAPFAVYGVERDATLNQVSCWVPYEPGQVRCRAFFFLRNLTAFMYYRRTLLYDGAIWKARWTLEASSRSTGASTVVVSSSLEAMLQLCSRAFRHPQPTVAP